MPRKRKPIDMQTGNITQINQYKREAEEKSVSTRRDQLAHPPEWLVDDVAKKEWKRIIEEMKDIEIVGNLDRNNIGCYCNAFADYLRVTKQLAREDYCIERETRTGTIIVKNPLVDLQRSYADEMRKFAGMCGLTIDSRLKAAAVKTSKAEEKISSEFGAI